MNMSASTLPSEQQQIPKKNTQLPPINNRQSQVQVLDQKKSSSPKVSRMNVLSPVINQMEQREVKQQPKLQQTNSEKRKPNKILAVSA